MQQAKKRSPFPKCVDDERVLSECDDEEEETLHSVDESMDRTFISDDLTRKEGPPSFVCGFGFDDIAMGILSCLGGATEQEKACASATWVVEESDLDEEESDFFDEESITSTRSEREERARKWKSARARKQRKTRG